MRFSAPLLALTAAVASWEYGPEDCVSLGKSEVGTCVLKTTCRNIDTSKFEFAFVCTAADGSKVKHTYGEGGFEAEEDYDTDVQCASCDPPPGIEAHVPGHAPVAAAPSTVPESRSTLQKFAASEAKTQTLPPASAAFYGPAGCVATYRSPEGTCLMQTRCKSAEVASYNFGLTCVDNAGDTTRHVFGMGSFDATETFDTLVECKLCLGLDGEQLPGSNATSTNLAGDVTDLKREMKELQEGVLAIKEHLGMVGNASAPTAATTAAPTTAAPTTDAATDGASDDASADAEADADAGADDASADDASADDASADADADAAETAFLKHRRIRRHRHKREDDDLDELLGDALD